MDIRILAVIASLAPALLWLWFFYTRDRYEREPKALILKLFLWGLFTAPWAAGFNDMLDGFMKPWIISVGQSGAVSFALTLLLVATAAAALNEEVMKYLVTANSTRTDPNFNERVDGMIYMTTAALAFAAGENFIYILGTYIGVYSQATEAGAAAAQAASSAFVAAFLVNAPLRALLTATGHVAWSGIVGYFLAQRVVGGRSGRVVIAGVLLAAALHTAFNYPQILQQVFSPRSGLLTGYFAVALLVWAISVGLYVVLLRRSLAGSPFRSQQLRPKAPAAPAAAPKAAPSAAPVAPPAAPAPPSTPSAAPRAPESTPPQEGSGR